MLKRFARWVLREEREKLIEGISNLRFQHENLLIECDRHKERISELDIARRRPTARHVVNRILDREIKWVNWQAMPEDKRRSWADQAKSALGNQALQSLIGVSETLGEKATNGEIVRRCIENIAKRSKDHRETENMRMIINGVELIRELLEEMLLPSQKESMEDIHAPI